MDWIRRNWPDLLIGVALVAVIAGIIITLLSGGSFSMFDRSRRTVTTPNQTTTTNSPFSSPDTTTPANNAANNTTNNAANTTTNAANTTTNNANTSATTPDQSPAQANAANSGAGIEPILPDLPVAGGNNQATTTTTADTTANTTAAATNATTTTADTTTTTAPTANAASTPIPPAAAATAPYRVSVGAFGQRQNAETLANTFRERGYPVFVAQEGEFFLALVGPYEQETAANQAANRIRAEGSDALVYRLSDPEPATTTQEATTQPAATQPAPAATTTPAATPAATTTTQNAPDTSWTNRGGTYLQVGAYASLESSLPQRRRLESLGFNVSERFSDELVRLVIGPFTEAEVPVAQAQLSANGIDNFPVQ